MYNLIAPFYDEVNEELDYDRWADYIVRTVEHGLGRPITEPVLDLGCGTGRMTVALAERGWDMIGVDASPEMLDIARENAKKAHKSKQILLLHQDMTDFELYGTVDAVVSCLDCINHLTTLRELDRCFQLVHLYLSPDGLFLFDVNGRSKFETVYARETYTVESDGRFCIWENDYDERSHLCDFCITVFEEGEDGRYTRHEELSCERMYTIRTLKQHLARAGFEVLGAYADFEGRGATDEDERIYFVARAKKG